MRAHLLHRRLQLTSWRVATCGALLAIAGCAGSAPDRPQLLVVIDTNAPLVEQVASDSTLSPAAAIDTVRVDVIGDDGSVVDFLDVVAPSVLDWPISFGVEPASGKSTVHLRIRGFQGRDAAAGRLDGRTTLEPIPQGTIDRLVDVTLPSAGKRLVRVKLDEDCIGRPPVFLAPRTTCVDASQPTAAPTTGVMVAGSDALHRTEAGSWSHAHYQPCTSSAAGDRVCIPGGFFVLGDPDSSGLDPSDFAASWPPRPVVLSPFWIDRDEMTVKRFRLLVASGAYTGPLPFAQAPGDATRSECSWLGTNNTADDDLALTCVNVAIAGQICAAAGGSLPSEAQWEYVARGRGQGRRYPWGDTVADCCTASVSRHSTVPAPTECSGTGPEPVGSHPPSEACGGLGDVSLDGVVDMGGGVSELTRDSYVGYADPCWGGAGILDDPDCHTDKTLSTIVRGGNYSEGAGLAAAALRHRAVQDEASQSFGVRCVYPDKG